MRPTGAVSFAELAGAYRLR